MLHVRIIMRLGAYASSRQDTDTDTGGGVVTRFDPGSVTRGTACQTQMCVQGDLKALICGQAVGSSRPRSSPTETFEEVLKGGGT